MEDLGIGWMDLLIVTLLIVGLFRGRKRGMSEEFLDVVKWGLILGIGSFCYAPVGGIISSSTPFSRLFSYVATYMAVILIVTLLFSFVRKHLGGKLIGSDTFGSAEYYLGMCAGAVRYACMIMVAMALLHARYYSPAEARAQVQKALDSYGSDFFPSVCKMQRVVFQDSLTGRATQSFLPILLIKSTSPEDKGLGSATLIKAREHDVYEVLEK